MSWLSKLLKYLQIGADTAAILQGGIDRRDDPPPRPKPPKPPKKAA